MIYKLVITLEMERLIDKSVNYLVNRINSKQAAKHLLDSIDEVYLMLETNPSIFRESQDKALAKLGYREAKIPDMNYVIVYKTVDTTVYVLCIFHCLEDYNNKLV